MNGYLLSLTGVCVLTALICAIVPAHMVSHVRLLCGFCIVCVVCMPAISMIDILADGAWELPDAWGQVQEEQDNEQLSQSMLTGQLQMLLEQEFSLLPHECSIRCMWKEDGGLQQVTLILSGKAIWRDPDPICAYVEQLLGCPCTVVLDG